MSPDPNLETTFALTRQGGKPTQSVLGGSLFCECKAGEFVRVMQSQVLARHATHLPDQPLSTCEANPFSTATAVWPTDRPIAAARGWLNALPPTILRVKGSLETPESHWQVERTVDTLELKPAPTPRGRTSQHRQL